MGRHPRTGGKPIKTRRRKAATLKRRNSPKATPRRIPSAAGQKTKVALLTRERDEAGSSAELRRLNWALEAYARSSTALLRHDDLEDLVTRICEAIVENDIYALSFMGLCEPSPDRTVRVVAGAGRAIGYMEGLKLSWSEDVPEGQGATGTAIRSGLPSIVQDTMIDPGYAPWRERGLRFGLWSAVCVPLEQKDKVIGTLNVYAVRSHAFGPKEIGVFSQLAREIAFAISMEEERIRLEAAERAQSAAEDSARDAQAELQRVARISTIGEFTASIAHELNQPLAAIVTNGNASLRWLKKEPLELDEARAAIRRTISDADRASSVIKRMAALLGKDEPKYVDLDLNEVIEEVLTFSRSEQRRSQITVHTELLAGLQLVRGDRIQLQQVMLNLILNAIEAMRDVVDRARLLQIQTGIGATGDAVVEVKDSGTGLDAAVMHRIFDRFFTTKAGGHGTGSAHLSVDHRCPWRSLVGIGGRSLRHRLSIHYSVRGREQNGVPCSCRRNRAAWAAKRRSLRPIGARQFCRPAGRGR